MAIIGFFQNQVSNLWACALKRRRRRSLPCTATTRFKPAAERKCHGAVPGGMEPASFQGLGCWVKGKSFSLQSLEPFEMSSLTPLILADSLGVLLENWLMSRRVIDMKNILMPISEDLNEYYSEFRIKYLCYNDFSLVLLELSPLCVDLFPSSPESENAIQNPKNKINFLM